MPAPPDGSSAAKPEDASLCSFEDEISPSLYPDLKIRLADVV